MRRHSQNSGEAAKALQARVQAGLEVVAHHQDAIDWQIQVLHRQFGLLQEYTAQITAEIASLEQKWSELEAAKEKLLAAEQRLQESPYSLAARDAD